VIRITNNFHMSEIIEQKTQEILNRFEITSIPVSVERIAAALDIQIKMAPSSDFSGLLIRKSHTALIGINKEEPHTRQRFTIAHELGHYFLDKRKDAFVDNKASIEYRDNKSHASRSAKESRANMFAAALLMPRPHVKKDFKRMVSKSGVFLEDHLSLLADKYLVSREAMQIRLKELGLIRPL